MLFILINYVNSFQKNATTNSIHMVLPVVTNRTFATTSTLGNSHTLGELLVPIGRTKMPMRTRMEVISRRLKNLEKSGEFHVCNIK